jgi:hypothetical protein
MLSTQKQGQERNKLANELRLWQGLLSSLQGSTFPLSQDLFDSAICLLRIWEYRRKELEDQIRHSPKLRKPFGSELLRGKLGQIQALGNAFQTFSEDLHVRASQGGLNMSATNTIAPPPGYRSSLTAAHSPNPRALGGTQASSRVPPRAVARNQPPGQGSGHPFTASQSAPAQSITQAPLPGMPTRNASGNDQALPAIPPQWLPTEALQTHLWRSMSKQMQDLDQDLRVLKLRVEANRTRIDETSPVADVFKEGQGLSDQRENELKSFDNTLKTERRTADHLARRVDALKPRILHWSSDRETKQEFRSTLAAIFETIRHARMAAVYPENKRKFQEFENLRLDQTPQPSSPQQATDLIAGLERQLTRLTEQSRLLRDFVNSRGSEQQGDEDRYFAQLITQIEQAKTRLQRHIVGLEQVWRNLLVQEESYSRASAPPSSETAQQRRDDLQSRAPSYTEYSGLGIR